MKKKQKLDLGQLKVKSFVTSLESQEEKTVQGGQKSGQLKGCGAPPPAATGLGTLPICTCGTVTQWQGCTLIGVCNTQAVFCTNNCSDTCGSGALGDMCHC